MNTETALIERSAGPFLGTIGRVAARLSELGWAEANAGNVSIRLGERARLEPPDTELAAPLPELAGACLLVSGAGTRMRDVARSPLESLCLVRLGPGGTSYRRAGEVRPTSELPAHLGAHAALARAHSESRCLLHAHPTALVALTLAGFSDASLLSLLERTHPGFAAVRDRVAVVPPHRPGTGELARATGDAIALRDGLVWPGHGMIAAGPDLDACLDVIEVTDKAAELAILAGLNRADAAGRDAVTPRNRPGRSLKGRRAPDGIETFYDVRTRDSELPPERFRELERRPVTVVLDNLRSAFNVGSVFRLADAARCAEVITCGYTCHPPHAKLEQTALGTTASVPTRHARETRSVVAELKRAGVQVVGVETAAEAVPFHRFDYRVPAALVFGNEALGVSRAVLDLCDGVVDIPVAGYKNSVNVAAAAGIVLFDLLRRLGRLDES